MIWVFWTVVGSLALLGALAAVASLRFERGIAGEALELWANLRGAAPPEEAVLRTAPAPVRRYLETAIRRRRPIRSLRLQHGGTFRTRAGQPWLPIRGEQYVSADPPGFVWWGRLHIIPGIWIDARDRAVDGRGGMRIVFESAFTIADLSGPAIDQGAQLRLLAEMAWFPTAFLDRRYVSWRAIDDTHARAVLRQGDREVEAVFEFGPDGLPVRVTSERYRDEGGTAVLTRWSGEYHDFREVDGVRVPHEVEATWHLRDTDFVYAHFLVEEMSFDDPRPYHAAVPGYAPHPQLSQRA